jgi:tRNA A-37 threonylcarbamoyl transferase component Bud32
MSFNVGENIGPYTIVEQLGQGGMATVFKAYHASLDRYVAFKVLHPALNTDQSFAARFQREARVVARLEHPNIVPVYDYAEHETRPYLVMKFIEGNTLKARMDQGPLSADEIAKMVEAIGSALAYAHKKGVLHRDVKPSNVLLANDGSIYLADFGLARMAQSGESTLSSDTVMGTPQYISPEQAMGKADLDQRTDLYSFGVMLYEMVVGRVPFNADTPFAIIHDHIYSPLPLPRKVNPNVPEPVERVILKALAKERTDRFGDADQLVSAFKQSWSEAGVPMQGTFIRVSQAIPIAGKTDTPGQQIVQAPLAAPGPAEGAATAKFVEAEPSAERRRSPWMWVSVGLGILLCLAVFAVARNTRLLAAIRARNSTPVVTMIPPSVNNPAPTLIPAAVDTPLPPPSQPVQTRADADTHLNLALEAWQNNDLKRSMDEVNLMVSLGPDRNDFLVEAGTELFDAGQYIGAAAVYGRVAQNYKNNNQMLPPELRERLEPSFYFAVEMDDVPIYIPLEILQRDDPPLAFFATSRYGLLHGDMDAAHQNLDQLLRVQPGWPMAQLLNAEILMHDGKQQEAHRILQELINSPRAQEWVKEQANILLSRIQ